MASQKFFVVAAVPAASLEFEDAIYHIAARTNRAAAKNVKIFRCDPDSARRLPHIPSGIS